MMNIKTTEHERREDAPKTSDHEIPSHASLGPMNRKLPGHGQSYVSPRFEEVASRVKEQTSICIATGHQPNFFHPGIAYRLSLGAALKNYGTGNQYVFWSVDHEKLGSLTMHMPENERSGYKWKKVDIIQSDEVPSKINADNLPDLPGPEKLPGIFKSAYAKFNALWNQRTQYETVAQAVVHTQFEFMKDKMAPPDLVRSVSELGHDPDFLTFAHSILSDAENYRKAFNSALDDVRARHKIRHPALPLPALDSQDTGLWAISKKTGHRQHLRAVLTNGAVTLDGGADEKVILSADPAELEGLPWQILPRAAVLTQFIRFYSCDLFVHGLGGSAYEEVNDILMGAYFQKRGAPYIVASFTWLNGGDPKAQVQDIQQRLRRAKTNPEEMVKPQDLFWELAEAKREALMSLRENRNRQAHGKIQEANRALHKALAGRIAALEEESRAAQNRLDDVIRDYPVIFMDEEAYNSWERS